MFATAKRLNRRVIEVAEGIHRVTQQLPLGINHVHCYVVRLTGGGWMLVDTGLGLPGAEEWWQETLAALDGPLERIVITHFHPDHVGGSAIVAALSGAPVYQGELDHGQGVRVWRDDEWLDRVDEWFTGRGGMPSTLTEPARRDSEWLRPLIRFVPSPRALRPGEPLDGWEPVLLPGHADGQLGLLSEDGVLIAGDGLLPDITPIVGLYPESRPDPLADFIDSLERVIGLAPRLALPGHGNPIADPAGRARELLAHHSERLDHAAGALAGGPQTAYEVSLSLWEQEFTPTLRRMAVAETLAHLEHLLPLGRARRSEEDGRVTYTPR